VYQLYLQGRFEANKRTPEHMKLAAQFFQEAVAKDPRFALGYSGLADVYNLLASTTVMSPDMVNPAAREAAAKALALDESLAEAHVSMAEFLPETEAERHFKRALELNPGYAQGHLWYGRFLAARGKVEEGIREMEIAQSLDPLAPIIAANLSEHYRAARQLEKALQEAQRTVALEPAFARGHVALGQVYETQGRYDEAVAEFQRSRELGGTNWPEFRERLQHAYDKGGYRGYYEEQLRLLQQRSREQYVSPIDLAFVHTVLGHRSEAIAWLNKACEERNRGYPFVVRYPEWDSLRSDPKFGELVRRRDAGGCAQAYDPLPPSS
jgi:serine/threonine-protein kinase